MSGTASRSAAAAGEVTALSVHGPRGVLDLTVPKDATLGEVARTYAEQAGVGRVLPLVSGSGAALAAERSVEEAGLVSGSVLVAVDPQSAPAPHRGRMGTTMRAAGLRAGPLSALWLCVAVALALVAGWSAALQPEDERTLPVVVLAVAAAVGCLPVGPLAAQRVLAAPAFGAAACFAVLWDPAPERLPTVLGATALGAAVTAAIGRALTGRSEEALRVWMVVGVASFVVTALGALLPVTPQVVWSVLLLAAVLAARLVPLAAVDVPDHYLLDLDRLAVTAWSARERPRGRRGRTIVPAAAVSEVARSGARMVTASCAAILVVAVVAAPLLLATADRPLDLIGARCLVGFGGCALLFAARDHRHRGARHLLRLAGLFCLTVVAVVLLRLAGPDARLLVVLAATALAGILVVVAVFVGRGWRSAWWSRRAEIGESLCGAFAVGSLVVAVGFFRHLWEFTS